MADPTNLHAIDDHEFLTRVHDRAGGGLETAIRRGGALFASAGARHFDGGRPGEDQSVTSTRFTGDEEEMNALASWRRPARTPVVRL